MTARDGKDDEGAAGGDDGDDDDVRSLSTAAKYCVFGLCPRAPRNFVGPFAGQVVKYVALIAARASVGDKKQNTAM